MGHVQHRLRAKCPMPEVVPNYRTLWLDFNNGSWGASAAGAGGGAPVKIETGTTGLAGLRIEADADSHSWYFPVPYDLDVTQPFDARIHWSSDQTTVADTYTWTITYSIVTLNSTSAAAEGATALSTAIAQDTKLVTAHAIQATEWGILNKNSITGTGESDYAMVITATATTNGGTVASDIVIWYGVEIRYRPKEL